jgi:hypothetical protein
LTSGCCTRRIHIAAAAAAFCSITSHVYIAAASSARSCYGITTMRTPTHLASCTAFKPLLLLLLWVDAADSAFWQLQQPASYS